MNKSSETEQHNIFLAAYNQVKGNKLIKKDSKRRDMFQILVGMVMLAIIAIPLIIFFIIIIVIASFTEINTINEK